MIDGHGLRHALVDGLRQAARLRLLLPLYLCGLLLGLVQTWPLAVAGARGGLQRPFLGELAVGGADALANLVLGNGSAAAAAGIWVLLLLPLAALFGLLYNFFSGGVLHVYAGTRPFWAGCRRTFWSFTALGLLLVLAALAVLGVALLVGLSLWVSIGVLVLLQLLNLVGEYARAMAVTHDRRNPFVLAGMALRFGVRRLLDILVCCILGVLLHAGLAALYTPVAGLLGPSPLLVLWQQLALFAWLWVKFLRLAWAIALMRVDTRQSPG